MNLDTDIKILAAGMENALRERRRDLHRYPEPGWAEFRTASVVITRLKELGCEVEFGRAVIDESERTCVPEESFLAERQKTAQSEGASAVLLAEMTGGYTGVVATLATGRPGKTVALRFDMDCVDVAEATDIEHRPYREGFASRHQGFMHACGHDGHTCVGLGVAEVLMKLKDKLSGKIKFIFQPCEEKASGARAMVAKGVVDDADYVIGMHFFMPAIGFLAYEVQNILFVSGINADFKGVASHAGGVPEKGKNALLAASTAALNLHAIARHSGGGSRINVGILNAGTGRNVVPATAHMEFETRGVTAEVNAFMREQACRIIKGAAAMYDVDVNITPVFGAPGGTNSAELATKIKDTATRLGMFDQVTNRFNMCGSEDFTCFMQRLQQMGKQAAFIVFGASPAAVNHNERFDFDEHAMVLAVELLSAAAVDLASE